MAKESQFGRAESSKSTFAKKFQPLLRQETSDVNRKCVKKRITWIVDLHKFLMCDVEDYVTKKGLGMYGSDYTSPDGKQFYFDGKL